jgi:hypothetical protein
VPGRHDPQALARADRLELALRERDPVGVLDAVDRGGASAGLASASAARARLGVVTVREERATRARGQASVRAGSPNTARSRACRRRRR